MSPFCSQSEGVAHSWSQVGEDKASRCGRDVHLLPLGVFRDVHQLEATDVGLRRLPPQCEGVLCGFYLLKVSGRIDF